MTVLITTQEHPCHFPVFFIALVMPIFCNLSINFYMTQRLIYYLLLDDIHHVSFVYKIYFLIKVKYHSDDPGKYILHHITFSGYLQISNAYFTVVLLCNPKIRLQLLQAFSFFFSFLKS